MINSHYAITIESDITNRICKLERALKMMMSISSLDKWETIKGKLDGHLTHLTTKGRLDQCLIQLQSLRRTHGTCSTYFKVLWFPTPP